MDISLNKKIVGVIAMDDKEDVKLEIKKLRRENKGNESFGNEESTDLLFNDIFNTIKDKQKEFGKLISEYTAYNKITQVDVIETGDTIIIKADLPRLKNQDIEIAISEDTVDICAELAEGYVDQDVNYLKRERSYGEVRRSIKLPSKIKIKEAEGTFKDAVLTIKIPKQQKKILKLKIE